MVLLAGLAARGINTGFVAYGIHTGLVMCGCNTELLAAQKRAPIGQQLFDLLVFLIFV